MTKDKRNHGIVEHLRQRFKERYDMELTRSMRMMLLSQIHKKLGRLTSKTPKGTEVWKVLLYNQKTYCNQSFLVMYNRQLDQVMTVLPPTDSKEFAQFCTKVGLTKEQVIDRNLTAQERTEKSVDQAIERKRQLVVNEGLKRLDNHKTTTTYLRKTTNATA